MSLVFNFILLFAFLLMELVGRYGEGESFSRFLRYLPVLLLGEPAAAPELAEFAGSGAA